MRIKSLVIIPSENEIEIKSLIRCFECKYKQYDEVYGNHWCEHLERGVEDQWFCADGEKVIDE